MYYRLITNYNHEWAVKMWDNNFSDEVLNEITDLVNKEGHMDLFDVIQAPIRVNPLTKILRESDKYDKDNAIISLSYAKFLENLHNRKVIKLIKETWKENSREHVKYIIDDAKLNIPSYCMCKRCKSKIKKEQSQLLSI